MLDITKDIQSLTTFRRRSGDFMKLLRKSKRPVVLTVNGKAAAVVQDAGAYQRLLDAAALAFDDLDVDDDRIARLEVRDFLAGGELSHLFVFDFLEQVHGEVLQRLRAGRAHLTRG